MTEITEHMEVIGADGVHVGTVDKVEGSRIKLTKTDSGEGAHKGHHIDRGLVAGVEGNKVRLSREYHAFCPTIAGIRAASQQASRNLSS
jgi:hypothetical protein